MVNRGNYISYYGISQVNVKGGFIMTKQEREERKQRCEEVMAEVDNFYKMIDEGHEFIFD